MKKIELVDVIHRTMAASKEDVVPLVKYLGMEESVLNCTKGKSREVAASIANHFRQMGSNDFATFIRGEGVSYDEVVIDVGKKLGVKAVSDKKSVEENEEAILWKVFEDSLNKMSDEEKRNLFSSMGIKEYDLPVGSIGAVVIQQLMAQYGGFAVYRISLIIANMVSRALLGSGLTLATNAALTRTIGTLLGPIGWIASGVWLAVDLAGPAFRKTVPAVIHIAMLRQMLAKRVTIGVVGDGSSGKDSLLNAVFGMDSNINPVAGSTQEAKVYPLDGKGNAYIVNYPGFNDYRERVNQLTDDYLHHTDVFVMVVDIMRGVSGTDIDILKKLKEFGNPVLICLNKIDLVRNKDDKADLRKAAEDRLIGGFKIIETAFDPDPRLESRKIGCKEVHESISTYIIERGKNSDAIPPYRDSDMQ